MQPQPNFENVRRTILRQGPPGPVPFFELFADPGMVEAVLEEKFPVNLHRYIEEPLLGLSEDELPGIMKSLDMYVRFCREMGYDYVFMVTGFSLERNFIATADTAGARNWPDGQRYWQDEASAPRSVAGPPPVEAIWRRPRQPWCWRRCSRASRR